MTGRADGDLSAVLARRDDVAWVDQVHGSAVLAAHAGGCAGRADALVTTTPGLRLAVVAADCALLVLWAGGGGTPCIAAVHAGWRGTSGGVVAAAAAAVRDLSGVDDVLGWRGPCIGPCCYRFGDEDLRGVAARLGHGVVATSTVGAPSLDLRAAVALAASAARVHLTGSDDRCTACSVDGDGQPSFFSHRARGDAGRHGVLACLR